MATRGRVSLGIAACFLVLGLAGCRQTASPSREAAMQSVRAADQAWMAAYASRNLDQAMSFLADDATVLEPNQLPVTGRDKIRAAEADFFADKNFSIHWEPVRIDVASSGDLAYSQGDLTYSGTDPSTGKVFTDRAKYLTVWKKQTDGSWTAVEDTYNTNQPLGK
jgi:ketosteroid isomerase-like protein